MTTTSDEVSSAEKGLAAQGFIVAVAVQYFNRNQQLEAC